MKIEINLDIPTVALTNKTEAELVISIIECLLFQRNQIPFMFPTFKYLLSNLNQLNETLDDDPYKKFLIQKQREDALITFNAINNIKKNIFEEFKKHSILTTRILFGATAFTPREAYVIKLPRTTSSYLKDHENTQEQLVKQILMSLLTSQSLYDVFSTNMPPTNTFIDLEVECDSTYDSQEFNQKEYIDLPSKCTTVLINVNHRYPIEVNESKCCEDMNTLNEIERLTINEDSKVTQIKTVPMWWEAKDVIKGFKETLIRGQSIW